MRIYIASALENIEQVQAVRDALIAEGHTITYDWTTHGAVRDDLARLAEVAGSEVQGVREADLVVVLLPGGRGTHAELGMACALGIPVLLVSSDGATFEPGEGTCAFYWARNVCRAEVSPSWILSVVGLAASLVSAGLAYRGLPLAPGEARAPAARPWPLNEYTWPDKG